MVKGGVMSSRPEQSSSEPSRDAGLIPAASTKCSMCDGEADVDIGCGDWSNLEPVCFECVSKKIRSQVEARTAELGSPDWHALWYVYYPEDEKSRV